MHLYKRKRLPSYPPPVSWVVDRHLHSKFQRLPSYFDDGHSAGANQGYAKLATPKPAIQRQDVPAKLKAELIQAIVFPVVTYGSEAWSLSKDECSKLNAFETKSYRRE